MDEVLTDLAGMTLLMLTGFNVILGTITFFSVFIMTLQQQHRGNRTLRENEPDRRPKREVCLRVLKAEREQLPNSPFWGWDLSKVGDGGVGGALFGV